MLKTLSSIFSGTEDILSTRWLADTDVVLLHCQIEKDYTHISVKGQHMHFVQHVISMIEEQFSTE